MKITAIQISNFLGASAVDVILSKPVALFAGHNYAGKSSLQEAIRMAMTGESVRVHLKKEYDQLLTRGQESGYALVTTINQAGEAADYSIVLPSGKGKFCSSAMLPYVLDAQRFSKMDAGGRRAFLFGLMGLKSDGDAIMQRLLARNCNAGKVAQIKHLLIAGFETGEAEAKTKARECKAQWKTTTGETWGSQKAAAFRAAKPTVDPLAMPQGRADLAAIEREIESESIKLGGMQTLARQAAEQLIKLAELREKADRIPSIKAKLATDEAELKAWEAKVSDTRKSASGTTQKPPQYFCPCCQAILMHRMADGALVEYAAPECIADPEAVAKLPAHENALGLMQRAVANDLRDLATAEAAERALREIESTDLGAVPTEEEITALKSRIEILKQSRTQQQAALRTLEGSIQLAQEADIKTNRAAVLHQDVQEWEAIAEALSPDGIQAEILAEALNPLNQRLKHSAESAEWLRFVINPAMDILAFASDVECSGRDYRLMSESEQWRADALIAEAISHLSGIRLLVLDRFDVLDLRGREDLLFWLDSLAKAGEIDSALIFGTLKGLPALLPASIEAFWIENGVAGAVREAA